MVVFAVLIKIPANRHAQVLIDQICYFSLEPCTLRATINHPQPITLSFITNQCINIVKPLRLQDGIYTVKVCKDGFYIVVKKMLQKREFLFKKKLEIENE